MARPDQNALKVELLRMRAVIERAEVRAAVLELADATQRPRRVLAAASDFALRIQGARSGGIGSLAGMLLGLLRDRPWLLSTLVTIATRRGRRRWAMLAGVAAVAAWLARSAVHRTKTDTATSR